MVPSSIGHGQGEHKRPMDDSSAQPFRQVGGDEAGPRSVPKGPQPGMGMAMAKLETSAHPKKLGQGVG